jgi:hypothetical protein
MKTLFTMGFAPQAVRFGWDHYNLGQDAGMVLSQADRDKLLGNLNRAAEELKAIQAWQMATPMWQGILGSDLKGFQDQIANVGQHSNGALAVQTALSTGGPVWNLATVDWNDATYWVQFVDGAQRILQKHATVGGPQAPAPGPSPLMIGAGVAAAIGLGLVLFG